MVTFFLYLAELGLTKIVAWFSSVLFSVCIVVGAAADEDDD